MSTPDKPKIWPDVTGNIDLEGAVKEGDISHEVYESAMRGHATIGDLATRNSQVEAPQDTAEIDPETVPMYAASWLPVLSPENGTAAVFGVEYYDPNATRHPKHREYWTPEVAEEDRIPGRAYDLMHDRDFARTGKIPAADADADARAVSTFYKSMHREMGITADPKKNVGMTLVRTDGYSLLSLGIDITGEDRSPVAFAAKGDLSAAEILRRASAVFPEAFKRMEGAGVTIGETPREVIDLT